MSVVTPSEQFPHQSAFIAHNAFDANFVDAFLRTHNQFAVLQFFQSVLGRDYLLVPKSSNEDIETTYHIDHGGAPDSFVMWIATKKTHANHFVDAGYCAIDNEQSSGNGHIMLAGDFSVHDTRHTCHADPREGYRDSMGFMFIPRKAGAGINSFMRLYRHKLKYFSKKFMIHSVQ